MIKHLPVKINIETNNNLEIIKAKKQQILLFRELKLLNYDNH